MRKTKLLSGIILALCCYLVAISGFAVNVKPFQPGERVVIMGDSITHYGTWWGNIWCGYVAKYPDNHPLFINAGISGDTATGALSRLDRDVFPRRPDAVCIMFGMNDVRYNSYKVKNTPGDLSSQKRGLESYKRSMDQLLKRITDKKIRCIVITPSPYDQSMVNPKARQVNPGCNGGLAKISATAKELAKKYNCELVDFHGPMTLMNIEKQKKNPAATIIGMDRIHPRDEGSKIMAELFLTAQGIDPTPVKKASKFKAIWEHINLERNLRSIAFLNIKVLKRNNIDLENIEAAKSFLTKKYKPHGADKSRIASYCKWRGKEAELNKKLKEIEARIGK